MKKMTLGLLSLLILLPMISYAQTVPQAPSAWVSFQKEQNDKRAAFFKEMRAEKEAFISAHPEVKTYLDQIHEANRQRIAALRAALHK